MDDTLNLTSHATVAYSSRLMTSLQEFPALFLHTTHITDGWQIAHRYDKYLRCLLHPLFSSCNGGVLTC